MSLNVLLIDDEAIVREVLGAQLQTLGHRVLAVASADAACLAAESGRFDLLLVDQRLGLVDGRDLLHRLRQFESTSSAPAIAISAELSAEAREGLIAQGFAAALQKPLTIDTLSRCLGALFPTEVLDDQAALAVWGRMETVRSLRAMLVDELPVYRSAIEAAHRQHDESALNEVLHRMKSSAGFCGARPLSRFIEAAASRPIDWSQLLPGFDAACAELMPALRASTVP